MVLLGLGLLLAEYPLILKKKINWIQKYLCQVFMLILGCKLKEESSSKLRKYGMSLRGGSRGIMNVLISVLKKRL